MKAKLLIKNITVIVVTVLILGILTIVITDFTLTQQNKDYLKRISAIYESTVNFNTDDFSDIVEIPDNTKIRITVIDKNGNVLADSGYNIDGMDNHLDRKEVQGLINGSDESFSSRKSSTGNARYLYYAKKIYNEDKSDFIILRMATLNNAISGYIGILISTMAGIMIVIISITVPITIKINNSVVKSVKTVEESLKAVNNGTYKRVVPSYKDDELNKSFNEINEIQYLITTNMQKLSEEKSKLNSIISNLDNGVIIMDNDIKIVRINDFAAQLFNVDDSIIGKDIYALNIPDDLLNRILEARDDKRKSKIEFNKDGRTFEVYITGGETNVILTFNEITAIKNYTDMKNEFFTNASHELKTPITSIVGFVELYQNTDSEEEKAKYIDRISVHSRRMMKLTGDMMEITKLDDTKVMDNISSVDIASVCNDVKNSLEYLADKNGIKVNVNGNAELVGNKNNIEELIENLLSNAIRYNKKNGYVNIDISGVDNGVQIIVSDNGIGIPKDAQNRIFERFYRVDKGRSKQTGGTGLGLSIVKRIVNLYDGEISVRSDIGEGSEFTVKLFNRNKNRI